MTNDQITHRSRHNITQALQDRFSIYRSHNLINIPKDAFEKELKSNLKKIDPDTENFHAQELDAQRDLSIKFHWGHDHDFGNFFLSGRMGNRHIDVTANFLLLFDISPTDFCAKDVLDIGCWTGGTALLLASLGSTVVAIEEVKKYANTARYLAHAFGIEDRLAVESRSIYDCNESYWRNRFDIAFFPGVIYHLTDPLLALRVIFNSLKLGGIILIESAGLDRAEPICSFEGSDITHSGTKGELNRGGWNWFVPSPSALSRMMSEAGFSDVQTLWHADTGRVYGYAQKKGQRPICRAGLSVRDIP